MRCFLNFHVSCKTSFVYSVSIHHKQNTSYLVLCLYNYIFRAWKCHCYDIVSEGCISFILWPSGWPFLKVKKLLREKKVLTTTCILVCLLLWLQVQCYFLDHGDTDDLLAEQLHDLDPTVNRLLPYQVQFSCLTSGVSFIEDPWSDFHT